MENAKERRAEFRHRRRRKPIHRARMMIEENDVGLRVVNGGLQFLESRAFDIRPVDRLIFRQDVKQVPAVLIDAAMFAFV
jgi:hypothetical protein